MMFDSDKAANRCRFMWRKLGGLLEKVAYSQAERGLATSAVESAKLADVCFWHATGEMDALSFKEKEL